MSLCFALKMVKHLLPGRYSSFFTVESGMFVCAILWNPISYDATAGAAVWQTVERNVFLHLDSVLISVIWSQTTVDTATTLIPIQFRCFRPVDL